MRKVIILSFLTLDGVMQAPGGPEEDPSEDFKYGGWSAPYLDETSGEAMKENMSPSDLLLGRKTFDIFESYWPKHTENWPGINEVTKYVLSEKRTESDWQNSEFLRSLSDIKKLKESEGTELKIWGSSKLIQLLLKNDLIDELRLIIMPITLGQGKKLFDSGTIPAAFTLTKTSSTPSGVIFANYTRAGEVKTGMVGA